MEIYRNSRGTFRSDNVSRLDLDFDEQCYVVMSLRAPPCTSVRLYRLHYEILQFYHFMIPTEEENAVRQQVIDRICAVIHQYLPTASVRDLLT